MSWSADLQEKMLLLSPAQRRAILLIVAGEVDGIPLTRLLKTPYSCPHCGLVAGRSGEAATHRKALLAGHTAICSEVGQQWKFAAIASTYYSKWKPDSHFAGCLSEARAEIVSAALDEAARILQIGTPEAARELRRQIEAGDKDFDKRSAAVALLDRADVGTAVKTDDSLSRWLTELRGNDEPMAESGPEGDDISEDRPSTEPDPGQDTS